MHQVGAFHGAKFMLKKQGVGWTNERRAQHRVDCGLTKVASSLKGVEGAVGEVKKGVDVLLALGRGEVPDRAPDQTDAHRIQQLRDNKRQADKELPALLEREANRKASGKRQCLEGVTQAAEIAAGSVAMATEGMPGDTLADKEANHKAQGKVLAAARRAAKAEEKAVAKAAAKAAASGAA